jgi:alpha-ribazole phosphatase
MTQGSTGKRVLAIRHAPVLMKGMCYGRLDVPVEAMPEPAELERRLGRATPVRAIVSSPARRCAELAECFGELLGLGVRRDSRLLELSFGAWEGRSWNELEETPEFRRWMRTWKASAAPGGETLRELEERVDALLDETQDDTLLVTHAGVIRAIGVLLEGMSWDEAMRAEVPHLEVRTFRRKLQAATT